jgi:hypothetical protein
MIQGSPQVPCGARPQRAEATKNTATPIRKVVTPPNLSASLPPRATRAARASTYALTTHCWPTGVSGGSEPIDGGATATTV